MATGRGSLFENKKFVSKYSLTQLGCVGWNSYLSLLNQKKGEQPEVSGKVEELLA